MLLSNIFFQKKGDRELDTNLIKKPNLNLGKTALKRLKENLELLEG